MIPSDFVEIKLSLTSHTIPSVYGGEIKCFIFRDKRTYDEEELSTIHFPPLTQIDRERGLDGDQTITKTQEIQSEIQQAISQAASESKYERETLFLRILKSSELKVTRFLLANFSVQPKQRGVAYILRVQG